MSEQNYIYNANEKQKIRNMHANKDIPVFELFDRICTLSDASEKLSRPVIVLKAEDNRQWEDAYELLETIGALPDEMGGVVFYFVEDNAIEEGIFPKRIHDFLTMDSNALLAYDETGVLDDIARIPSRVLRFPDKLHCVFRGEADDIRPDCLDEIARGAYLQALSDYACSFNFLDDGSPIGASDPGYENVRGTIEALSLGYLSFPFAREEYDEVQHMGYSQKGSKTHLRAASDIARVIGKSIPNYDDIVQAEDAANRFSDVLYMWQFAVDNSGCPMQFGSRDLPIYENGANKQTVRKVAEAIGVDTMLQAHFEDGVPVGDLVA